jgi:hypothetical protein
MNDLILLFFLIFFFLDLMIYNELNKLMCT